MSKDLIQALEEAGSSLNYIANTACKRDEELMSDAINVRGYARSRAKAASEALSRHRSSVESVELPEGDAWRTQEQYSPDVGSWHDYYDNYRATNCTDDLEPLYTATTVRSLIAAAVERERKECAKVCGDEAVFRQGKASMIGIDSHAGAEWNAHSGFEAGRIACAAAIRARGEK